MGTYYSYVCDEKKEFYAPGDTDDARITMQMENCKYPASYLISSFLFELMAYEGWTVRVVNDSADLPYDNDECTGIRDGWSDARVKYRERFESILEQALARQVIKVDL